MNQHEAITRWAEAAKKATPGPWVLTKIGTPWIKSLLLEGKSVRSAVTAPHGFYRKNDGNFACASRAVDPAAVLRLVEAAKWLSEVSAISEEDVWSDLRAWDESDYTHPIELYHVGDAAVEELQGIIANAWREFDASLTPFLEG